ncbi:MAG TPA: GAF and ANTAR domain-containing protein [Marmoricola sp.]
MPEGTMANRIADAARELQSERDAQSTLDHVVKLSIELIPHAEHAGISLLHRRQRLDTPAATSPVVADVERLQYELGEGPCLEAIFDAPIVHSDHVGNDERWPVWGPKATADTGVRSMLCLRMFTHEQNVGALNLYATTPGAFTETDVEHGELLAAHSAVAVASAQQVENLQLAVDGRSVIGQAQGILMERFNIDAEHAFQVLARVSSHSNTKLRDVAAELIATRKTPGT